MQRQKPTAEQLDQWCDWESEWRNTQTEMARVECWLEARIVEGERLLAQSSLMIQAVLKHGIDRDRAALDKLQSTSDLWATPEAFRAAIVGKAKEQDRRGQG